MGSTSPRENGPTRNVKWAVLVAGGAAGVHRFARLAIRLSVVLFVLVARLALLELVVRLPALVHQLHVPSLVRVSRVHLLILPVEINTVLWYIRHLDSRC